MVYHNFPSSQDSILSQDVVLANPRDEAQLFFKSRSYSSQVLRLKLHECMLKISIAHTNASSTGAKPPPSAASSSCAPLFVSSQTSTPILCLQRPPGTCPAASPQDSAPHPQHAPGSCPGRLPTPSMRQLAESARHRTRTKWATDLASR